MSFIVKILKALKLFCTCKSTCIVGEELRITADTEGKTILRISYV